MFPSPNFSEVQPYYPTLKACFSTRIVYYLIPNISSCPDSFPKPLTGEALWSVGANPLQSVPGGETSREPAISWKDTSARPLTGKLTLCGLKTPGAGNSWS